MNAIFRQDVVTKQPAPHRALMIGFVAMPRITRIMRFITGMVGRQGAQAIRGQQFSAAKRDDLFTEHGRKWAMRQADRENLVRPDGPVVAGWAVDHIVETAGPPVGKTGEAGPRAFNEGPVASRWPPEHLGKLGHDA